MEAKYIGNIDFKGLKDFLLSIHLMLSILLSTGFILFLPDQILERMYLLEARDRYGVLIGMIFIISMFIILLKFFSYFVSKIKKWYMEGKTLKNWESNLKKLNQKEKEIIKRFTETDTNTLLLPMNSGIVIRLENITIIGKAANHHMVDMRNPQFPYFLQPWVYDYIKKNPNYFD